MPPGGRQALDPDPERDRKAGGERFRGSRDFAAYRREIANVRSGHSGAREGVTNACGWGPDMGCGRCGAEIPKPKPNQKFCKRACRAAAWTRGASAATTTP